MLTQLTKARDAAQSASAEADIALIEATASADALREEARKLNAAVAALSGEPSAQIEPQAPKEAREGRLDADLSPEEFEKARLKRQKAKEAEENANNPYSNLKCTGCGRKGRISEVFTENGTRMLECRCGNQML